MTMEDFIRQHLPAIRITSLNRTALAVSELEVRERSVCLADTARFYAPWFYTHKGEVDLEDALRDPGAKAMQLREVIFRSQNIDRSTHISQIRDLPPASLSPFPVATDSTTNRTLVLDGNHTLVALLDILPDQRITLHEILGSHVERFLGDFSLVNR